MKQVLKLALVMLIALSSANAWAQACDFDEDCLPDEICDAGFCAVPDVVVSGDCVDDFDCGSGDICDGGVCVPDGGTVVVGDGTCVDDLDCAEGDFCDGGICAPDGGTVVVDDGGTGGTTVVAHSDCALVRGVTSAGGRSAMLVLLVLFAAFFLSRMRSSRSLG
ncbi:MAG: hypothetical protein KC609_22485 [Myxococcales bacterium]|nr:hypothetical protein [Myxococcales bacterium]